MLVSPRGPLGLLLSLFLDSSGVLLLDNEPSAMWVQAQRCEPPPPLELAGLERGAHVCGLRGEIMPYNFISSFMPRLSYTPLAQQEGK